MKTTFSRFAKATRGMANMLSTAKKAKKNAKKIVKKELTA
jgi:hypothetical protein